MADISHIWINQYLQKATAQVKVSYCFYECYSNIFEFYEQQRLKCLPDGFTERLRATMLEF